MHQSHAILLARLQSREIATTWLRTRLRFHCRHLFPSAKLTSSSQWLSQEISLFLHEVSLSLEISVHKSPQRKFFPLQWISHGTAMGTKTAVSQVQVQVQVHLFTLIQLQYNNNKA